MVGFEYVRDTARLVRDLGMKNVVVTNGAFTEETLNEVLPYIDAFNIDLKGFTQAWYRELGGDLETVKRFIIKAAQRAHVELTTLIVPGKNDGEDEMRELSRWVASSLSRGVPLHITRFFPRRDYVDKSPTDIALLRRLAEVTRKSLETVVIGNV